MAPTTLRPELPTLPARLAHLPVDHRHYPVPWFVAWVDGVPDHRVMDGTKLLRAVQEKRCWICGDRLGRYLACLIGPMCAVNRNTAEPPSHRECAVYAAQACPFLTRPHAHRREAGIPEAAQAPAGVSIPRNPGACVIWVTRTVTPYRAPGGGILFRVGDPTETLWFCEGRQATRAEVLASIESGLPLLQDQARQDGAVAVRALAQMVERAMAYVPKEDT